MILVYGLQTHFVDTRLNCILHLINTFGEAMNQIILPPAMIKER